MLPSECLFGYRDKSNKWWLVCVETIDIIKPDALQHTVRLLEE